MTEFNPSEQAVMLANARDDLVAWAHNLELCADDENQTEADWWESYWSARIYLQKIALFVISSPLRNAHPDRRSINYKEIAQDITDDMKTILDPTHDNHTCPECNYWVPQIMPCIGCIIKASGIVPPNTPKPPL
jgi:hypothetical protein